MSRPSARTATLSQIVAHQIGSVSGDELVQAVTELSALDRYQASLGIEEAAGWVAARAEAAGLEEVTVHRYPADGRERWWSFRAPTAWTPLRASLSIRVAGVEVERVDHLRQPVSIATHSAPTPRAGLSAPLLVAAAGSYPPALRDAIVVVPRGRLDELALAARGVAGFVTCTSNAGAHDPGRIELAPETSLFGFSLGTDVFERVAALAREGAVAHAEVSVDRSARMPVVTGVLPGKRAGRELWLTAHLCHPRPSANDNASGVAALLGVAGVHAAGRAGGGERAERSIRFVWGPEFAGLAALLHDRVACAGQVAGPYAAINLDMVGEDQELCGGELLVERDPQSTPSLASILAERVTAEVFAQTGIHPGAWRPSASRGSSDHALFAAGPARCEAVALCHSSDRFNHTAADEPDKVSPVAMARATAAASALAHILATEDALARTEREEIVRGWALREMRSAEQAAELYREVRDGAWSRGLVEHVHARASAARSFDVREHPAWHPPANHGGARPAPRWSGPLNLRAMLHDLPEDLGARVGGVLARSREAYALLFNLAVRLDGTRTVDQAVDEATFERRQPADPALAALLVDALIESGWVAETDGIAC